MAALITFLILFIVLVGGGWLIGKFIGNLLFPSDDKTYIDKSVHHHHHYHTTINNHEHKSITIIDDETKQKIFELKQEIEKKESKE